jgi:ribonuclease HI
VWWRRQREGRDQRIPGVFWQDGPVTITAAADGSALGNPGPAGWAWYVNDDCWRAGGWPHGTNNQGELMAVLDLLRATAHLPQEDLHILCDSQYVINSITKWMPGWKRKGWRKADGKPVLNVDLLKELDRELAGRKYRFEWVKGHAGHDLNEAADERARAAATAYQQGVAARSGPGFPGAHHLSASGARAAGAASASGQPLAAPLHEPDLFSQQELTQQATRGGRLRIRPFPGRPPVSRMLDGRIRASRTLAGSPPASRTSRSWTLPSWILPSWTTGPLT